VARRRLGAFCASRAFHFLSVETLPVQGSYAAIIFTESGLFGSFFSAWSGSVFPLNCRTFFVFFMLPSFSPFFWLALSPFSFYLILRAIANCNSCLIAFLCCFFSAPVLFRYLNIGPDGMLLPYVTRRRTLICRFHLPQGTFVLFFFPPPPLSPLSSFLLVLFLFRAALLLPGSLGWPGF